jgi:hypothetical protein
MQKGVERVIVANTSITARAMKPYFDMAEMFGYKVFSIVVENHHGNASIHNVQDETLDNMRSKFELKL